MTTTQALPAPPASPPAAAVPAERADVSAVIRAHQRGLWRFVRWLGADGTLADDLVQDTFVAFLEHGPRAWEAAGAANPAAVGAWLRTVAARRFRALRRTARTGVPLADHEVLERTWHALAPDGGDARLDALGQCVGELPERLRSALELHYRHGRGVGDVARLLGIGLGGGKRVLRRCRELLARCVERRLREEEG